MTPPDSTAKVRRYTITHQEYDPMWASRAYAVVPADDHDAALAAERATSAAALAERDARIAELEAGLRSLEHDVMINPGGIVAFETLARIHALLATTHNHGGMS